MGKGLTYMQTVDYQNHRIRKWEVGASTYLAYPEMGARLMNWNIRMADQTVRDVIHWPESADFASIGHVRGGNPILFPFCGRSFVDGEIGFWQDAYGIRRPMPMHGHTRDGTFELVNGHERGFTALFLPGPECREHYPYAYEFRVRYRFEELSMFVDLELENHDKQPIPWSAGHHFYFNLPWHPGLCRKDYRVEIPAKKAFRQDGSGALYPVKDFEPATNFSSDALVDRIHCRLKDNTVRFGPLGGEEDLVLTIGDEARPPAWTTVVTWTEKPDSPFYCVEPWMGPPNSPAHKNGLHFVEAGRKSVFSVQVSLIG